MVSLDLFFFVAIDSIVVVLEHPTVIGLCSTVSPGQSFLMKWLVAPESNFPTVYFSVVGSGSSSIVSSHFQTLLY